MLADLLRRYLGVLCFGNGEIWPSIDQVLVIIMQSNFSKLGADGKPIYDERGKVMKGPAIGNPEPKILRTSRKA